MRSIGMSLLKVPVACAALWLALATAHASPAFWAVKSGDATVYLLGTIHVVKGGTNWETPAIAKAFADAQDLWLEETDADPATAQPLIARLGIDREHPLSTKVTAAEFAEIDAAAKSMGMPGEAALEPMRPWFAAVTLAVVPIIKSGYDPSKGVDKILQSEAEAQHKRLHAFETLDQQLHFFADLSPAVEMQFLQSTLDDVAEGPQKVDELVTAWESGDMEKLNKEFGDLQQPKFHDIYEALIVRRNQAWADQIARGLQTQKGVVFIAVGAGHFTGPDALQTLLERHGLRVERQ